LPKNAIMVFQEPGTPVIAKLLLQNVIWVAVMGALLFVPAGTLHWPAAWVFLGTVAALGVVCGGWLAKTDPALLAERMNPMMQRGQPFADKVFMPVFGLAALTWFVTIGHDARIHAFHFPFALQALGMAMLLVSTSFVMWVMRANSFASPVVKLQTERGHRVISSGPYAYVRHPMYSASVLFFGGAPLLLGSWWGLAMAPLFAVLFAIRARIEERALVDGLPGYADYTRQVHYRLLPGLW
jgi:protein-S-isoprenylcysteine O-methyltransferase Ste14